MKKVYLIIGLIFLYSCDSNKVENNKRTQDFILKIKENFNTNDNFIKIINGTISANSTAPTPRVSVGRVRSLIINLTHSRKAHYETLNY